MLLVLIATCPIRDASLTHQTEDGPVAAEPPSNQSAVWDGFLPGGAEGIRTPDLLSAIQARSQLRHSPKRSQVYGGAGWLSNARGYRRRRGHAGARVDGDHGAAAREYEREGSVHGRANVLGPR